MASAILVTGGTGTVGRPLAALLRSAGLDVRVASRGTGTDLVSGQGLADALRERPVIVHCASDTRHAGRTDEAMTRTLVQAAGDSGCPHLVFISIVGIDRNPLGYYRRKLATEKIVEAGRTPWTILRTTQFHELFDAILARLARLPLVPTSATVKVQPIAAAEVAEHLAEIAQGEPQGRADDLGGPQLLTARELITAYLHATGRRRPQIPVAAPGQAWRALREGAATTGRPAGRQTWGEYLEAKYA